MTLLLLLRRHVYYPAPSSIPPALRGIFATLTPAYERSATLNDTSPAAVLSPIKRPAGTIS